MDITPLIKKDTHLITSYGNGGFGINHQFHRGSLLLLPQHITPLDAATLVELAEGSLTFLDRYRDHIEILLVGAGLTHSPTPSLLKHYAQAHAIACDTMTTGAACRTYNVLLSEERQVAALLCAID